MPTKVQDNWSDQDFPGKPDKVRDEHWSWFTRHIQDGETMASIARSIDRSATLVHDKIRDIDRRLRLGLIREETRRRMLAMPWIERFPPDIQQALINHNLHDEDTVKWMTTRELIERGIHRSLIPGIRAVTPYEPPTCQCCGQVMPGFTKHDKELDRVPSYLP